MIPIPKISNPVPITINGVIYTEYFMVSLIIGNPDANLNQSITAILRPYVWSSNTIYNGNDKDYTLFIPNTIAEAQRSGMLQGLLQNLVFLTNLEIQEGYLKQQLNLNPNDTNLQSQLKAIEKNLGVNNGS